MTRCYTFSEVYFLTKKILIFLYFVYSPSQKLPSMHNHQQNVTNNNRFIVLSFFFIYTIQGFQNHPPLPLFCQVRKLRNLVASE